MHTLIIIKSENIEDNQKELKELKVNAQNTEELKVQLDDLKHTFSRTGFNIGIKKVYNSS